MIHDFCCVYVSLVLILGCWCISLVFLCSCCITGDVVVFVHH